MSADLFAEFSTDSNTNQAHQSNATVNPQPQSTFSLFDDLNSQAPATVPQRKPPAFTQSFGQDSSFPTQVLAEDDTDDWGDFEGGTSSAGQAPPAQHGPFASISTQQPLQRTWTSQSTAHDPFSYQSNVSPRHRKSHGRKYRSSRQRSLQTRECYLMPKKIWKMKTNLVTSKIPSQKPSHQRRRHH